MKIHTGKLEAFLGHVALWTVILYCFSIGWAFGFFFNGEEDPDDAPTDDSDIS